MGVLQKGAGSFMDAFSFHYYNLAAGGGSPDNAYVLPVLAKIQAYKNAWENQCLCGIQKAVCTCRKPELVIYLSHSGFVSNTAASRSCNGKGSIAFQAWALSIILIMRLVPPLRGGKFIMI